MTLVLIHSPLVGPFVWEPVASILRQHHLQVIVPVLPHADKDQTTFLEPQIESIVATLRANEIISPLVLIGHSGGGVLLPAIRQASQMPVSAYIFVDADIPQPNKSRLDLFSSNEEAQSFREASVEGLLPMWTDEDLLTVVPNAERRNQLVSEFYPLPLAVYEESISVFANWPDAPCAFLQFSPAYDVSAAQARQRGWLYRHLDGNHFHLVNEPLEVATTLMEMMATLNVLQNELADK